MGDGCGRAVVVAVGVGVGVVITISSVAVGGMDSLISVGGVARPPLQAAINAHKNNARRGLRKRHRRLAHGITGINLKSENMLTITALKILWMADFHSLAV